MYLYNIYGITISSDYKFEEAIESFDVGKYDILICEDANVVNEFYDVPESDSDVDKPYYIQLAKDVCYIMYPEQGYFSIASDGNIRYKLIDGFDHLEVNEIFLCLVIPMLLILQDRVMFHGSGLVWDDKCFVVSGNSGAGKSTVTNACINEGAKFLADDTVALNLEDGVYACSAYPQQKLCMDQVTDFMKKNCEMVQLPEDMGVIKYAVRDRNRFFYGTKKLNALVILNPTDKVTEPIIEELEGYDKVPALIDNLYKSDTYKKKGINPELFKKCLQIAQNIKIDRVSRPLEGYTTARQIELIKEKVVKG